MTTTRRLSGLKKLVASATLAVLCMLPLGSTPFSHAQATVPPQIDFVFVDPTSFTPTQGEKIFFHWDVDESVTSIFSISIELYNLSGGKVADILGPSADSPVLRPVEWGGRTYDGSFVAPGVYRYVFTAFNTQGTDTREGHIVILEDTVGEGPEIINDFANPDPFNPNNEVTNIHYTIDQPADTVSIRLIDPFSGATVETLVATSEIAGSHTQIWDGRDDSGTPFVERIYTYEITATNQFGSDTESGTVEIDYDTTSGNPPEIVEHFVIPSVFDPDEEDALIYFRVDQDANVDLEILDGGSEVVTLAQDTFVQQDALNFIRWDGDDRFGQEVDDDVYTYEITACNPSAPSLCDTVFGSVEVDDDSSSGGDDDMRITNDFADPDPFNPDEEDTRIFFTLSRDADVVIEILDDDGDLIEVIVDDQFRDEGANSVSWDGRDRFGNKVQEGDYKYRIEACAVHQSSNCDSESGPIEVDYDLDGPSSSGDLISDVHVKNRIFDPEDDEESEICLDIEKDDVELTIEVLDDRGRVVETLVDEREYDEQSNRCFEWDGRDDDHDIVDDDIYQFRVFAERGSRRETEFEYVQVDTDGIILPFPNDDDGEFCTGFTDVYRTSPLCRAIEMMFFRGVFTGYPDSTFRPDQYINRAEAAKVMVLALNKHHTGYVSHHTGYYDVPSFEWYAPYLASAKQYGIAHGYPDGSFRPNLTVNRAELLKMFIEATDMGVPHCNFAPYKDTPITFETRWYIDYVCLAKAYGLMRADINGNFNPAEPMTRGDVADLFFQAERFGLTFAGYSQQYYDDFYRVFDQDYYYSPGFSRYYDPYYSSGFGGGYPYGSGYGSSYGSGSYYYPSSYYYGSDSGYRDTYYASSSYPYYSGSYYDSDYYDYDDHYYYGGGYYGDSYYGSGSYYAPGYSSSFNPYYSGGYGYTYY